MTDPEVHALLRAAGASSHGLAARNYAMVQLMLQAGLRVGEVSALQVGDATLGDRSGTVRIRHGKGLKALDVPLNATARRALRQHLDRRPAPDSGAPLFASSRNGAMPVRTVQAGGSPPAVDTSYYAIRAVERIIPEGEEWRDTVLPLMYPAASLDRELVEVG